jgi:hypothetical protein
MDFQLRKHNADNSIFFQQLDANLILIAAVIAIVVIGVASFIVWQKKKKLGPSNCLISQLFFP